MPGKLHVVQKLIEDIPEFGECDKVTGEDCFVARLYLRSIDQLDQILDRVADYAETNTSIVKTKPIGRRPPPFVAR
jgi:Lrp/AsnC family leucine-responsive transcriptional regulator